MELSGARVAAGRVGGARVGVGTICGGQSVWEGAGSSARTAVMQASQQ